MLSAMAFLRWGWPKRCDSDLRSLFSMAFLPRAMLKPCVTASQKRLNLGLRSGFGWASLRSETPMRSAMAKPRRFPKGWPRPSSMAKLKGWPI